MQYTEKTIKVGYFEHWTRPDYKFVEFLQAEGYEITKIDYSKKNYLEPYDVVFVEQNGFNDYIENDEEYIRDWVKRGGLFFFMHQSYERWAPYFLPDEVGYTQLIHRLIGRYFSVQFVYNLRHFGKRGSKQMSDYDYKESKSSVGMGSANTGNRFGPPMR